MTASLSGVFNVQQFGDAGAPLVGGRLYTYAQGTTTHKTAYTDKAGTIPHTYTSDGLGGQYIALNARGEVPGNLYFAPGRYDVTLKTADGTTKWTRRSDQTADPEDYASTTSGKGAALVGYKGSDTGAVARTVQAKLDDFVSVKDFGAVGDGVTNDAGAFQAAIDNSAYVYIPEGTYKINSSLYWRTGVQLIGASKTRTVLDFSSVTGPCFTAQLNRHGASFTVQGCRDSVITGFKVVGNTADATNHIFNSDYGWHRNNVHDVWFYSCGGNAINLNCDNAYGGFYSIFHHNIFGDPSDFSTGTDTTLIKGDAIWATGSCNENTVSNNVFWRVKGDAIHLVGTLTWTIQRWTIKNNGVEWAGYFYPANNQYGVRIEGNSQRMTIRENYFEGNGGGNTSTSGGGIYCNNTALDIGITENLFANQTYDINLNLVFNANIQDNTFVSGVSGFNIRVGTVGTVSGRIGQVRIGHNPDFNNTLNKFLSVAAASVSQVYGDPVVARQRGTSCLWGKFTPRLYGGATEISCSSAIGVFERRDDMLVVDISMTVSNLNGAVGSITVTGSDGNTGKIPGISSTIGYTSRNDAAVPNSTAVCQISNVTLGAGFTQMIAQMNQSASDVIILRKDGSGVADTAVDATNLAVGSLFRFKLAYYI